MDRATAKKIVENGVLISDITDMLKAAYDNGAANDSRSRVNKGFSKSYCFNVMWKTFALWEPDAKVNNLSKGLAAVNALMEFGDYWRGWKPEAKAKRKPGEYRHEPAIDIYGTD